MASVAQKLTDQKLIAPPLFMNGAVQYETITGSMSYGVSSDSSDMDIMGFCIPDKGTVFPHTRGEVEGFGTKLPRFEQFQQHHVKSLDGQTEYDVTIYNIVKFFQLCMENNPNMVDSLYTPDRCITHITNIGKMVRENRDMFLHKGSWHKFKGYAYQQMKKIRDKANSSNPKRAESIAKYGYDVKFAYHVVRLINESEMIMTEHTLDIERSREQLKSIRRGEWTMTQLEEYAKSKEAELEKVYNTSTLRYSPDEDGIKNLLMQCLEEHYGSLDGLVTANDRAPSLVLELEAVLRKYR
jgi:uncharacterized protein